MRLDYKIIDFFKLKIVASFPGAKIYLFGSRVSDEERGGDIDLMILTNTLIDKRTIRAIRLEFFKSFGWQKIDLVNFTYDDDSVFKKLIQINAIELL
jgi:predicted nucleotidyltransferase